MTEPEEETTPNEEPPTKPRSLFFARLAAAVRRQDWFVVALEVAIVVLGVVIGFQVTAWGQARADAERERAYLRQIIADLSETERVMADASLANDEYERVTFHLHRAFYSLERPPRDTVLVWIAKSEFGSNPRPILGSVSALVESGDLALVRNDSLRSAVVQYLEETRRETELQAGHVASGEAAKRRLWGQIDFTEAIMRVVDPDATESIFGVPVEETAYFEGPRRSPRPLAVERFLTNEEARTSVEQMVRSRQNLRRGRNRMREDAAALRTLAEVTLQE